MYMVLLSIAWQLWYSTQLSGTFVFFNDVNEWMGIDKLGHFITAFYATYIFCTLYSTVETKNILKKTIISTSGFWVLLPIEVMDGFCKGYGFSVADATSNLMGSLACSTQLIYWNRIYVHPAFSYYPSPYAELRPELLGSSYFSKFIKDYNAQTYWLSVPLPYRWWPQWLMLSVGYGADGLLGGDTNQWVDTDGHEHNYHYIKRLPQVYISLDIDLTKVPFKNNTVVIVGRILNFIKIPLPYFQVW